MVRPETTSPGSGRSQDPPEEKVLFVDDDKNLLDAMRRTYRRTFNLSVACGGQEGFEKIAAEGPFAVVVSDFKMPGMNGIEFLEKVKAQDGDTVRIMLTGNADLESAVHAVNRGGLFRFLLKPCTPEVLKTAIEDGIRQFRLVQAERVLLEQTLRGSIKVLAEVLSLVNPSAFGRATRIRFYVRQIIKDLGLEDDAWAYETAALLAPIGLVSVPAEVLQRRAAGQALDDEERRMIERAPEIGRDLIAKIPRLEPVAEMIGWQAYPARMPEITLEDVPLGSRVLRAAIDFDLLIAQGASRVKALAVLAAKPEIYDAQVLEALKKVRLPGQDAIVQTLRVKEFRLGMILDQDIHHANGSLVVAKGTKVSTGMLERLRNYAELGVIREPIRVRVPQARMGRA